MSTDQKLVNLDDQSLNWRPPTTFQNTPANVLAVLQDQASLTARLKHLSQGNFSVEVVKEGWVELSNRRLLAEFAPVDTNHRFWSRHVVLFGNGKPWVLAHSLLPEHAIFTPLRKVMELNEEPLGQFLFRNSELRRTNLELVKSREGLWGRRSLFYIYNKPIMVAEFFVQNFPFGVAVAQMK